MAPDDQALVDVTPRTKVRRFPPRGHFDKKTIWGILDKAIVAHIGFTNDGSPAMLPMMFFRNGDYVYFHGAARNRMFGAFPENPEVCFTATVIDGFVMARAALHHSMNYRSVIIYGTVEHVEDPEEKLGALKNLIERFYPNRWNKIRPPSVTEFARVGVYRLPIREVSAKIRNAFPPPVPDEMDRQVWTGVMPIETRLGIPTLDPHSNPETALYQDFSRIAEILKPSEGANLPFPPGQIAAEVDNPGGGSSVGASPGSSAEARPMAAPALREAATKEAGPARTVTATFILADGSRQDVAAKVGGTLMQAATAAGVPGVIAECGGSMACGTCHVYVDAAWANLLPLVKPGEESMLEFVNGGRKEGSRLSCQILVTEEMEGLQVTVPEAQG